MSILESDLICGCDAIKADDEGETMKTRTTWLSLQCARLAAGVLERLEQQEVDGFSAAFSRAALRYYVAPIDLLPDYLPFVGLLDDFLMVAIACQLSKGEEKSLTREDIPELEERIRKFFVLS